MDGDITYDIQRDLIQTEFNQYLWGIHLIAVEMDIHKTHSAEETAWGIIGDITDYIGVFYTIVLVG